MDLRETVEKYLAIAGGYGKAVALAAFGLSREETERRFSQLDEDYHISRFLHLNDQRAASGTPQGAAGPALETYQINGFAYTHVVIDAEIKEIL